MKVLVTGGAGFIASHIVDKLIEQEFEVICVDNLSSGKKENVNPKAVLYEEDITSTQLRDIFDVEKPDYVIHQAAQIDVQRSITDPNHDAYINIIGTINLLENCKNFGVKKLVYASSAAVYGNPNYDVVDELHPIAPLSPYGISKYVPEFYIKTYNHAFDLNYTILRYSNVYGIRQVVKGEGGVIAIFVDKLLKNEPLVVYGDGSQTRDFINVSDIAEANVQALHYGDNHVFNVSRNEKININELIGILSKIKGEPISPIYKPFRTGDILHSCLSNEKALSLLNWVPKVSLEEGLLKTINYYQKKEELIPLSY
ncbi:NAD-dependent epimerase/dehydratase family protein [Paenibacillus sp. GbtcB18]|uniref:NAD-dependent epimerase/dehydratase family protein n=1 Tax=Paenibacillus sp. GbtcB18 TaxID=2824763 RepID=UPI001C3068DE|nr:NAD-dependent epimerase/dehydratase family protein [Paenibacillus sp. GbtcB18]